ncbi:MAG: NADH-quinone oxidoreductase subunit C [Alphaproteobacteria bacterium]|nr:NADH-quinone oxidoreductase subunit C [Alphaproteobacteria bacterium]
MFLEKIIKNILTDFNYEIEIRNDLIYVLVCRNDTLEVLSKLRNNSFKVLIDCFATNHINNDKIVDIYYHLLSYQYNQSVCIYTTVEDKVTQSILNIFTNANWYEREMYEMYNINFTGHDNLRELFSYSE